MTKEIADYILEELIPALQNQKSFSDYGDHDRNIGISDCIYILHRNARRFYANEKGWETWGFIDDYDDERFRLVDYCCNENPKHYDLWFSKNNQTSVFCPRCGKKWHLDWEYLVAYLEGDTETAPPLEM